MRSSRASRSPRSARPTSPQSIRVVAPALLPDNPSKPNKRLILLLAVFAGAAIALSLVLVLHLMDGSLTTVDQAERALGLRSLGAVPLRPKTKLAQTGRLLIDRPNTAVAEAFRGLRTALHFAALPDGCRTVLDHERGAGGGEEFLRDQLRRRPRAAGFLDPAASISTCASRALAPSSSAAKRRWA